MTLLLLTTLIAQTCGGCTQTFDKPVLSVVGQGVAASDVKTSDYTVILYADVYHEKESEARNKADMMKSEITKVAKKYGAKEADVVLTNLNSLEPIEGDPYYRIEQDIQITLTNIDHIDQVKEQFLLIEGASIGSVTPIISGSADYSPAVKEARLEAVAQARTEAKDLADAVGVLLGELLYVSEDVVYPSYTGYETYEQTDVTVGVTMVYEILYKK
ncbi:SIMPL domain-containing protein [candidate division WOR-3 bacterium]|nr:SIMPL domain-containing protein [candidate division WOR-3 bacterium]